MAEKDPLLLTPGPLTTSARDQTGDAEVIGAHATNAFIHPDGGSPPKIDSAWREAEADHVCVPLPGSGTSAVEAMLGTIAGQLSGHALILVNGAYGRRIGGNS